MNYSRLYADGDGESHVEELRADFDMLAYAPPAPAIGVSRPTDATRYVFVDFPANWSSERHPTPRRQLFVMLAGHLVGEASDGTVMDLKPGDVLLMEDTTGKGHTARTMDGAGVQAMIVHLE
jgi:quercetin dioxygenase-like cupin family protein